MQQRWHQYQLLKVSFLSKWWFCFSFQNCHLLSSFFPFFALLYFLFFPPFYFRFSVVLTLVNAQVSQTYLYIVKPAHLAIRIFVKVSAPACTVLPVSTSHSYWKTSNYPGITNCRLVLEGDALQRLVLNYSISLSSSSLVNSCKGILIIYEHFIPMIF